jgi:hypothetical protein
LKINTSLASFGSLIKGLAIWGVIAILVGLLSVASSRSSEASAAPGMLIGALLIYVGSGLLGLAIFGAFLRITAKSIIEGLGGNLSVTGLQNQPSAAVDSNSAVEARINAGPSDAWQSLSGKEYKAWQAAGQPDLRAWDQAGRPEFSSWLAGQL